MSAAIRLIWDSGFAAGPAIERVDMSPTPDPAIIPPWLKHMPAEVIHTISDRYERGELPERIAQDYGLNPVFVEWILAFPPEEA